MPTSHPLLQPRQLMSDAEAGAAAVAALLRPPATEELPGTLRVVVAKMAGRLAQERPRLVGRLLPPLLALAKRTAPPSAGSTQTPRSALAARVSSYGTATCGSGIVRGAIVPPISHVPGLHHAGVHAAQRRAFWSSDQNCHA